MAAAGVGGHGRAGAVFLEDVVPKTKFFGDYLRKLKHGDPASELVGDGTVRAWPRRVFYDLGDPDLDEEWRGVVLELPLLPNRLLKYVDSFELMEKVLGMCNRVIEMEAGQVEHHWHRDLAKCRHHCRRLRHIVCVLTALHWELCPSTKKWLSQVLGDITGTFCADADWGKLRAELEGVVSANVARLGFNRCDWKFTDGRTLEADRRMLAALGDSIRAGRPGEGLPDVQVCLSDGWNTRHDRLVRLKMTGVLLGGGMPPGWYRVLGIMMFRRIESYDYPMRCTMRAVLMLPPQWWYGCFAAAKMFWHSFRPYRKDGKQLWIQMLSYARPPVDYGPTPEWWFAALAEATAANLGGVQLVPLVKMFHDRLAIPSSERTGALSADIKRCVKETWRNTDVNCVVQDLKDKCRLSLFLSRAVAAHMGWEK